MRMLMVEKELKEKEVKWKAVEKDAGEGAKTLAKGKKDVETLQKRLIATGWDSDKEDTIVNQIQEAREQIRTLSEVSSI